MGACVLGRGRRGRGGGMRGGGGVRGGGGEGVRGRLRGWMLRVE